MKKKKAAQLISLAAGLSLTLTPAANVFAEEPAAASEKPRLLITQDGEVDDMNSLIHTILYANEVDLEGIVQSSSKLHYSGDEQTESLRWMGTDWMYDFMDAYAEVYPNLAVHSADFPTPEELRAITVVGNIKAEGEMAEETDGSNLIKERILADDARPLYIEVGGGANTIGRALKSIEEEYSGSDGWDAMKETISSKVVLYSWGFQDTVYADYISQTWPDIKSVNVAGASIPYGYKWGSSNISLDGKKKMEGSWMYEHIVNGHGPLLDYYVTWGDGTHLEGEAEADQFGTNEAILSSTSWWGKIPYNRYDFLSEGDTPAWLAVVPTGLRNLEDESWGGWAGRYEKSTYKNNEAANTYEAVKNEDMSPWVEAIQEDFAARADWCITSSYEEANHAPAVSVTEGVDLTAKAGDEITLHAEAQDPDGDEVTFLWSQYAEADTYPEAVEISVSEENPAEASFTVPEDAKSGETIHIIVTGKDNGIHNLQRYQRVVITVE